jgi:hypothetical protein
MAPSELRRPTALITATPTIAAAITAASTIATVAAAWIDRISTIVDGGMVCDAPVRRHVAAIIRKTTAVAVGTAARRPTSGAAVLPSSHERAADHQGRPGRDQESGYRAGHRQLPLRAFGHNCAAHNTAASTRIRRQMWRARSLIIQAKYGILRKQDAFRSRLAS